MKFAFPLHFIFAVIISYMMPAHAQVRENAIEFKGLVIDGPFKNQRINGYCLRNPAGDRYKQRSRCLMRLSSGFKVIDNQASLEVTGGLTALRITLGPRMEANQEKGNFKISAFQATTFYDREISLFELPVEYSFVEVSIAGVSIAGGGSSNPDCLIWDIAGDGPG